MKTLLIIVITISILCSSAVMADRSAMRAALGNLASARGGTEIQHLTQSVDVVSLGRFCQPMKIFPVVKIVDGDEKDRVRAEAALRAELQKVAFRCNFTVVSGVKPPAGSLSFSLIVVKDRGQSTSSNSRSDSESWGGSSWRRGTSNHSFSSSSYREGGESTYVGTSASGGLDLNEEDGSTTGIAYVDNVFSANEEKTGSSYRSSSSSSYSASSRRWGSSSSSCNSLDESGFNSDPEYSRSMSSRVTIAEAVEKAVRCVLARGIDFYNATHGGTTGDTPQRGVSPTADGEKIYAVAVDAE